MATTTNYGWTTPDDTSLVKDGASAIRTLGSSIDTTTKNLNPSTTLGDIEYRSATANTNTRLAIGSSGQVLTVAAGVPSWATPTVGDITEVQAGVGISVASGTGPIPVITNSSTDLITTAGDLLYGTAADTVARLGIGTAGQVLKVNSGATAPEWGAAASGGGMTLLNSGNTSMSGAPALGFHWSGVVTSMSGATHSLTSISGSYKDLQLIFRAVLPANDANSLRMRFNGDSTSNRHANADDATKIFGSTITFNATSVGLTYGMDNVTQTGLISVTIPDYANTSTWKMAIINSIVNDSTTATSVVSQFIYGIYNQTGAITSLDFFFNSGNITSGSVFLYGVQ